jgi:chemotaxis signal transduction protein
MSYEPGQHLLIQYRDNYFITLPLKLILGVYPKGDITPIPNPEKGIIGLANLEGKIVPIQDTIIRFNLQLRNEKESYIILIRTGFGDIGVIVPRDFNVENISQKQIDEGEKDNSYIIIHDSERHLIILDLHKNSKYGEIENELESYFNQID